MVTSVRRFYTLEKNSTTGRWTLMTGDGQICHELGSDRKWSEREVKYKLRLWAEKYGQKSELRIRNARTGRLSADAYTYPRRSDPRKSKG